ncbi:MAG: ABC transporter ATP-binding protein, partial [Solobacterium sp.]|nr:ABC transporter ATP-binding protein [Solobacterium sp.]
MVKALRYLKPFWLSVLAIIALTFMQVQFELALPDYMSNIVTYGIQYNGIDDPAPEALRASTYDAMRLFMNEEEQKQFEASYTLENAGSPMQDIYPALASEAVYIRTDKENS